MNAFTNETHDPDLSSWVQDANDPAGDFPVQNLPLGVFLAGDEPRIGVAIGSQILDLRAAVEGQLLAGLTPEAACALCAPRLNHLLGLGPAHWKTVRGALSSALRTGAAAQSALEPLLVPQNEVEMVVAADIGDYTDFYASLHHATNVGTMFRPENPLLPNYKHLPVGYHGRASSIVISGTPVVRPSGQLKSDDAALPTYAPCRLLDYELEMGVFTGPSNAMGLPIPMSKASEYLFGMVIVNDWSARDVQKWEYQPLGPFNGKNFATSVSPWVVTLDALAPFRVPGPPRGGDDPETVCYLKPTEDLALNISVELYLASSTMRQQGMDPLKLSSGTFRDMYWTIGQMLVHHTSTGCNMRPGDLLASGTVSGAHEHTRGSLLERTWRGEQPLSLPDGTERRFLQDGDEVIIKGFCEGPGTARIGFGTCRGVIEPAVDQTPA